MSLLSPLGAEASTETRPRTSRRVASFVLRSRPCASKTPLSEETGNAQELDAVRHPECARDPVETPSGAYEAAPAVPR